MNFPEKYKALTNNTFSDGEYSIVPIRYQDRFKIMQWRNEQIYHLRQAKPLTKVDQENYFTNVVAKLFEKKQPGQILFSYLKNDECIGYGGLVHINWVDKNAEISFIMHTELEDLEFEKHWEIYLELIEDVAYNELKLHKVYTYAFNLRPRLYKALENKAFIKEAVLKEHALFEDKFVDVIIHSKINRVLGFRKLNNSDKEITFNWANDKLTRKNSFSSELITFQEHSDWIEKKIQSKKSCFLICLLDNIEVGLVRFDLNDEDIYIIGITIDEKYRGKSLAWQFIKKACHKFYQEKNKDIIAYIKYNNLASKKAFEKAGFQLEGNEDIKGIKSYKYKYEKYFGVYNC